MNQALEAVDYFAEILSEEDDRKVRKAKPGALKDKYINEYDLRKILSQHLVTTGNSEKNIVDVFILELKDSIEPDYVSNYFRRYPIA